jgi:hypothetical protein
MATINTASRARANGMSELSRSASWSGHRRLASRQIEAEAQWQVVNKLPKSKVEIQDLLIAELRRFAHCEEAWSVVVVGVDAEINGATWTVSRFNRGESDAHACDRALQLIVPHYQQLYDLKQKH